MNWVVMEGNSKAKENMGKVEKGIEMGMGKDITDVSLLGVRIFDIWILEKIMVMSQSLKRILNYLGL